jgi:hypothetical protein
MLTGLKPRKDQRMLDWETFWIFVWIFGVPIAWVLFGGGFE